MWKHQLQTNMSEPIHVKSCPERSISAIETTTPPGCPKVFCQPFIYTLEDWNMSSWGFGRSFAFLNGWLVCSMLIFQGVEVFLVPGTFSSTFFVGHRLHRSFLVFLRSESLRIQSFCWALFLTSRFFWASNNLWQKKGWFLDYLPTRYLE